jgi:hypothetical protein
MIYGRQTMYGKDEGREAEEKKSGRDRGGKTKGERQMSRE